MNCNVLKDEVAAQAASNAPQQALPGGSDLMESLLPVGELPANDC